VIISCGAVKSPHLLLLSGIGPEEELKEHSIECHLDAPQVGKNLEDHLGATLFCKPAKKEIGATNAARAQALPGSLKVCIRHLPLMPLYSTVRMLPRNKSQNGVALPCMLLEKYQGECTDAFWGDYARTYSTTIYYPSCTCAIGKVVDSKLKVMGLNGLRIADASVFPTNSSGNTNAACIMVGEKCADMIAKEIQWA
jgi:choline dehydrogenase-like flavoprotein